MTDRVAMIAVDVERLERARFHLGAALSLLELLPVTEVRELVRSELHAVLDVLEASQE